MEPITIETTIHAPLSLVWECFTVPEHIIEWNFASEDWTCPYAGSDLQVGGSFSYRMEAKDGSMGFDFAGTYTQVETEKCIEYSFGDRSAKVSFVDASDAGGNKVRIIETFDPETEHPIEMQRAGWQAILDRFKGYVEKVATKS